VPLKDTSPTSKRVRQPGDEGRGGLARGADPVRRHVGGLHGDGRVERDDDRGPLARHLHVGLRTREGRDQCGERQQEQAGGDVPSPRGAARDQRGEQVELGEAQGVRRPAPLQHDVGHEQREDGQQQPEAEWLEEAHDGRLPAARVRRRLDR
jgi:hypothetical protein